MATHDFLHYFIHFIKSFVLKPHFIIFDNTPEHFPSCWWPQSLKTRLLQNIIFSCTKILYIKWRLKQYFWQWTLIICGLSVWEHEMRPRLSSQISELKNCYRSHYSKEKKKGIFLIEVKILLKTSTQVLVISFLPAPKRPSKINTFLMPECKTSRSQDLCLFLFSIT